MAKTSSSLAHALVYALVLTSVSGFNAPTARILRRRGRGVAARDVRLLDDEELTSADVPTTGAEADAAAIKELLQIAAATDRGATATEDEKSLVDTLATSLEAATDASLDGRWRLIYASEVRREVSRFVEHRRHRHRCHSRTTTKHCHAPFQPPLNPRRTATENHLSQLQSAYRSSPFFWAFRKFCDGMTSPVLDDSFAEVRRYPFIFQIGARYGAIK